MKKRIIGCLCSVALLGMLVALTSATPQQDEVMTKEDGMYVINTTTLGKQYQGYVDITPVKIYIKKNKVVKVEPLKNQETPKYWAKVKKQLINKWDGLKVKDAKNLQVDAVTGATFSSEALVGNVKAGLEYYEKNK